MTDWDTSYIQIADMIAKRSKDPRTKVGAVLVDELNRVVSIGYNGFPRGAKDDEELYADRPRKLMRVIHAEVNAILFAKSQGHTMYITHPPCCQCMALMIQAGIKRIVWRDTFKKISYLESLGEAIELAHEANVTICFGSFGELID